MDIGDADRLERPLERTTRKPRLVTPGRFSNIHKDIHPGRDKNLHVLREAPLLVSNREESGHRNG
jgi:hypothetical protein